MPQSQIKVSKKQRSKIPKKRENVWPFFEKILKDKAFILPGSS
jgi:hypothetical protein